MSVLDEVAVSSTVLPSTGASPETDDDGISEDFREVLAQLAHAREEAESYRDSLQQQSRFGAISNAIGEISSGLQEFFDPDVNLYARLTQTTRFFSAETSARTELLSSLQSLTQQAPVVAAGVVKDLFALQSAISDGLQNLRGGSDVRTVYAKIAYFKLSFAIQMNNLIDLLTGNSLHGQNDIFSRMGYGESYGSYGAYSSYGSTTRFAQMTVQLTLQEVTAGSASASGASLSLSLMMKSSYTQTDLFMAALDPLVLDMNGDGIDLRPVEDGVLFDLAGDGEQVRCGFVSGDDALLFLDEDGDGVCTSGTELFGDQEGDANGYAELAKYDSSSDGVISNADDIYHDLKIWQDLNADGRCQQEEVQSLEEAGVEKIGLRYLNTRWASGGNEVAQAGFFQTSRGAVHATVDANFNYLTPQNPTEESDASLAV